MIIINADDWGRTIEETERIKECYKEGRIASTSAMVFMKDSERAAGIANEIKIDVGLHLNLDQRFTTQLGNESMTVSHELVSKYLSRNRINFLIYNYSLQKHFRYVYEAQVSEFQRLYGRNPSHINGHHHLHLCANMLCKRIIPNSEKIRRSFDFFPRDKNILNRMYRGMLNRWLESHYSVAGYFFSLPYIVKNNYFKKIIELSRKNSVEINTHPIDNEDFVFLMSKEFCSILEEVEKGTYSSL